MPPLLSYSLELIRLIAIPVFIWAAYQDIKTRRVSNKPWLFLASLGIILLLADALIIHLGLPTHRYPPTFWRSVALSIGLVLPLAYAAWLFGLFGGADAKALMALALLFPVTPTFTITTDILGIGLVRLPEYTFPISIFAFTIFANAILISMLYPAVMLLRNIVNRDISWVMPIARPLPRDRIEDAHGVLFETRTGFGRTLDLDVLRSYLSWRDITLQELTPLNTPEDESDVASFGAGDAWGVSAYFDETDDPTYGMDEETLSEGLHVLHTSSTVWVSPGIPYMVPFAAGLCIALTYGNLMIALLILLQ